MVLRSLVGSVTERTPTSTGPAAPSFAYSRKSGFPAVQHRSKSAFARGRDDQRRRTPLRSSEVPPVQSTEDRIIDDAEHGVANGVPHPTILEGDEPGSVDWRQHISAENERRVESMTEEEREEAKREILDRFGLGVQELFDKVSLARKKQAESVSSIGRPEEMSHENQGSEVPISSTSHGLESPTRGEFAHADIVWSSHPFIQRTIDMIHSTVANVSPPISCSFS
jgi:hypothetical protein